MYLKKNFKLWLAVFAMALPLLFVGTASAKYMSDGAVPAITGGFVAPTDGACVISIDMAGNVVIDATITNKRDCDARLVDVVATTSGDTLASVCGKTTKNTAGLKYAAPGSSTCVSIDGSGFITGSFSMKDLDKNAFMCQAKGGQLANATVSAGPPAITVATKTVANGTAAKCLAYGWQYRGQDATGTPLTDLSSGAGFCYAKMNTTLAAASCPSTVGSGSGTQTDNSSAAFGYAVSGTLCQYSYGINGPIPAALTKADGTTYAALSTVNFGAFTTAGTCLANGGSWANWMPKNGTASGNGLTSYATFDLVNQAVNADEGCLHCHSTKVQQNGPSERWKDSYLKTGHKNMLRKVNAGSVLTGPDGVAYANDGVAANTIDWTAAQPTVLVSGVATPFYYVWGDWMIAAPTLARAGNVYGCGACHTAGFKDNTNPGVQSIGTPGYTPAEPAKSGAAWVAAVTPGHKWDLEGITCGRCHNATVPSVTAPQIAASTFPTTAPTSGGMGALASGTGRANLCFGCHQSIAKLYPPQGGTVAGATQYDPTLIPTGINHGAAAGRDFNGHVLGNSFLNSVHARYTGAQSGNGSIKLNTLGKFDLTDPNGTTEYNSIFKGYTCWQGPVGNNSPGKTKADGTEIKTKTDCESIYGAGSWRADQDGSGAATSIQGTCTTCHDVHNSLFVGEQAEFAIRKTCANCHVANTTTGASDVNTPQVTMFNHPRDAGTPFDTSLFDDSCVVCHMATQAEKNGDQNSMPVHVWRINTDAAYNTFPTAAQFNATDNTKDRNAQVAPESYVKADGTIGTYNNAVWVDLDLACGQCHGGSLGAGATHNNALYLNKTQLSSLAKNMHAVNLTAGFTWSNDPSVSNMINFDASAACPTGDTCSYSWNFGDGSTAGTGATPSHTYALATAQTVTVTMADNGATDSASQPVLPKVVAVPVVVNAPGVVTNGLMATVTDNSSGGNDPITVLVNWGDGTSDQALNHGAILNHSYATAKTYAAKITVSGSTGSNFANFNVVITPLTVSGLVSSLTGTPLSGAFVTLKVGTVGKYIVATDATGHYTVPNVAAATYNVIPSKSGYVFTPAIVTVTNVNMTASFSATNK